MSGFWKDNAICSQMLGLCSALAVTNKVENAIAMGAGVVFVLIVSSFSISLMRGLIPARYRIIVYMITIATFVIIVDQYFKAYFPSISKALGPYLALIITNCILMGRAEAYAMKNNPWHSICDALGSGLGYAYSLIIIASFREVLAFGTFLNFKVTPAGWENLVVMAMAPGAFFLFAIYLWVFRTFSKLKPLES